MPYFINKDSTSVITVSYLGPADLDERKKTVDEICKLVNPDEPVKLLIDARKLAMNMSNAVLPGILLTRKSFLLPG